MKGVAEIGLERFFKPINILHCVVGVLNEMKVKKAVVLFLVGYEVSVKHSPRDKVQQNENGDKLFCVFHLLNIGIFSIALHACLATFSGDKEASIISTRTPFDANSGSRFL